MGEYISDGVFRVVDVTIETESGTISRFVRAVTGVLAKLYAFFERTEHRYQQFNYLGEWHSHPLFALRPSQDDFHAMRDIIDDPEVGANFVILMLVKSNRTTIESRAWSLLPGGSFTEAEITYEGAVHESQ